SRSKIEFFQKVTTVKISHGFSFQIGVFLMIGNVRRISLRISGRCRTEKVTAAGQKKTYPRGLPR
ncbi:hypothetical protein, partial [uncultured Mobiluncus sp.]|uniref:hypothetical protein n=1 Tax=uncultured Mobiluncus sp. TaxID=293425 RepID=UPI00260B366B